MNIRKTIKQELVRLQKDQERYSKGKSMDYKYRYWSTSGKVDVLKQFFNTRKLKLKDIEDLKLEVQNKYEGIRRIPKAERNIYQTFDGIYLEGKLDIINDWVILKFFKIKP